jgi:hypothetical protein
LPVGLGFLHQVAVQAKDTISSERTPPDEEGCLMASILKLHTGSKMQFRVEWEDNDRIARDRLFNSFAAAERFAFDIEAILLRELIETLTGRSST